MSENLSNKDRQTRRVLAEHCRHDIKDVQLLETTGLAHKHYRLGNSGKLARVPIHSQHGHKPLENLVYQAACFARVSKSSFAPLIYETIEPTPQLPMGALIVEEISGRHAQLPKDLSSIAVCLASIHNLPAKPQPPLAHHASPVAGIRQEVEQQAIYLNDQTSKLLHAELKWMRAFNTEQQPEPTKLVCTDTHPGNFLIDTSGKAFIVDLEKALYGSPSVDLAHTTVYTSTTWDMNSSSILTLDDVQNFYQTYLEQSDQPELIRHWLKPMRRLLILRALTWCALWQSEHQREKSGWSKDHVPDSLTKHVAERTTHYLQAETIERIFDETDALDL